MHITVVCPACQSQYQVEEHLRGKRMRCPNTICRTVFEVRDEAEQGEAISGKPAAEPTPAARTEAPVEKPAPPPKWASPPPVRASSAPLAPSETPLPPGDLDIPGDDTNDNPSSEPPPAVEIAPPPNKKRGPVLVVSVLAVVFAVAAAIVAFQFMGHQRQIESHLVAQAEGLYQKGDFSEAMKRFRQLQDDFPKSKDHDRYRFLAMLSELRTEVDAARDPVAMADGRRHALEFLDAHQNSALAKAHEGDLFDTLLQLAKRSAEAVQENPDRPLLTQVETFWGRARVLVPQAIARDDEFRKTFDELRATLTRRELRQSTLAFVQGSLQTPTAAAIAEAQNSAVAASLVDDPEIAAALKALRDAHRASIAFVSPTPPLPAPASDPFAVIPLVTALQQPPQPARGADPVAALSPAGVLYALQARHGGLLWVERLGIDSRLAPLHIPHVEGSAARYLVVANDGKTVALLDGASGKSVWQHVLSATAISEPIAAPGHLLVPLVTGRVVDLNPENGNLNGSFQFDQSLPYGGTPLPDSSLVALPGNAHCVYVLDLAKRTCVHILDTGHAAGSLVGPPIVVPDGGSKIWLVLTEAQRGPQIKLRPIPYPPEKAGKRHEQDYVVPGTLSFPPRHDAESILLATEEGRLHRVGLRLRGNRDHLLFPLEPTDIAVDATPTGQPLKAMVAHVDAENIWAISGGRLHRLQLSFSPQAGPVIQARWPQGPWVGEPLHAAQVYADADGTTLFLATHDPSGPAVWLTAVDGETGKILWQSQLGSTPRGEPILTDERLVWNDGRVAYFASVPSLTKKAIAIPESPQGTMLAHGANALILGWSPGKAALRVTEIALASNMALDTFAIQLPAPIAAPPVVGADSLIIALTSGVLCRVDVKTRTPQSGPDWRATGVDVLAPTHLVRVRPDLFLVADGAGGLIAFEGVSWKEVARYKSSDRRLIGQPVLLAGDEPQLLAVDDNGHLLLLDAVKLQIISRANWELKGKVTAGPYIMGTNAFVVVDGKRLVAIDPRRDGIRWDVSFLADIACAPLLVDKRLVVADLNGNFWTLDPDTGANLVPNDRPALSLLANLVPAVRPIALPDGSLFILWSDGTAGVVSLGK